jgi:galactose mutarotase-like enzyme
MSVHSLENSSLSITVKEHGAELASITDVKTGTQYMWNADPAYWGKSSPVLFPAVGSMKDHSFTYQGKTYTLPHHGFARDMDFVLKERTATTLWFSLKANEDTLQKYPFDFVLECGYELQDRNVKVMWKVLNKDTSTMYFSIGAHPAFVCPLDKEGQQSDYYFQFDNQEPIHYMLIDENALMVKKPWDEQYILSTNQGLCQIDPHMFDLDALIIENDQCHSVALVTPDQKPYITVKFDAPLFGLWSPAGKNAPFICIEPWYGRCDATDFNGNLEEREWGNSLEAGKEFEAAYTIEIA